MQTVYIETSIVSFLRQSPKAPSHIRSRQVAAREWWGDYRDQYALVTSQYVHDEAGVGNPILAKERIRNLAGILLLPLDQKIENLADEIIARAILPPDAIVDALHIACTAVHRIDYLLTWNCKHIANPLILPRIFRVIDDFQLPFPVICTPQDMLDSHEDSESD